METHLRYTYKSVPLSSLSPLIHWSYPSSSPFFSLSPHFPLLLMQVWPQVLECAIQQNVKAYHAKADTRVIIKIEKHLHFVCPFLTPFFLVFFPSAWSSVSKVHVALCCGLISRSIFLMMTGTD